jgi:hypothetical protein
MQCKYSKSLGGGFDGEPNIVWGTIGYEDPRKPTVFCGMYDLRDFFWLWLHRGKAWVFWCGSDIRNFRSNFIFNDGKLLGLSQLFASFNLNFKDWLIKKVLSKAEHWCENEAEAWQLRDCGLKVSGICPSFFGDFRKYKVSFKPGNKVYLSANPGRELEYGWGVIWDLAPHLPEIEFHLFGSEWREAFKSLKMQGISLADFRPNITIHGKIPIKKMNRLVKGMQCGLRLNKHDGFSEITAKSVLWGQYPITYLYFPHVDQFTADDLGLVNTSKNLQKLVKLLEQIPQKKKPNLKGRNYYLKSLNKFPWNEKFSNKQA